MQSNPIVTAANQIITSGRRDTYNQLCRFALVAMAKKRLLVK